MAQQTVERVNGLDVAGIAEAAEQIGADPSKGLVRLRVASSWNGQTRTEHVVDGIEIGGEQIDRKHRFSIDEPVQLFGTDDVPNPQEYLLGSLNACLAVGYVANAALRGIKLDKVEIESSGDIDLRGFFGLDASVNPGYDSIRYTVRISGEGTSEQMREIHEAVCATSPNYANMTRSIALNADLVLE